MPTKKKFIFGALVIILFVFIAGGWWIWKNQTVDCLNIVSERRIEKCIGQEIRAIGTLSFIPPGIKGVGDLNFSDGTSLQLLEAIPNMKDYENKKVEIKGELYKCGHLDQCIGFGLKKIESVNLVSKTIVQEINITTDKTEYEKDKNINLTILNRLKEKILISSCPYAEGFVKIEKRNASGNFQEIELLPPGTIVNIICAAPMTLLLRQSHIYTWDEFIMSAGVLNISLSSGTYRIKFGYLISLPYSQENTYWAYSNEFTIQ